MFSIQQFESGYLAPQHQPSCFLSRKEFARLFGVSLSTIKRREEEGYLSPQAVNARVLHYTDTDVVAMLKLGYRADQIAAKELGVGAAIVATPHHVSAKAMDRDLPMEPIATGTPPTPDLGASFAAHQLLANFQWLLKIPEIRREIGMIVDEQIQTKNHLSR